VTMNSSGVIAGSSDSVNVRGGRSLDMPLASHAPRHVATARQARPISGRNDPTYVARGGLTLLCMTSVETNQGESPPSEDECPAIGAELKAAHDSALQGTELTVPLLAGTWAAGSGPERIEL